MRQIWIFFATGVGGDGLANLLEQCPDITGWAREGELAAWRVHRIVDDEIKFWYPAVDAQHCFRTGRWFDQRNNQLHPEYQQAVINRQRIIATSHDILLFNLDRSDRQDLLCQDQIKVLLDSRDYHKCLQNSVKKNLLSVSEQKFYNRSWAESTPVFARYSEVDRARYDYVIWAEDLSDQQGIQNLLDRLHLSIDPAKISQYLHLRNGAWREVLGAGQPPRYQSYFDNGMICYRSLG
jgi:hypothetical protein